MAREIIKLTKLNWVNSIFKIKIYKYPIPLNLAAIWVHDSAPAKK